MDETHLEASLTNEIVQYDEKQKSWITITVAGATAGIIVGAVTFSAANSATKIVSSGSKLTMDAIGEVAGLGTTYLVGPVAGHAVRLATKAAAKTTEQSIEYSGLITAGVLSAAAGAVTALSITAGTKLIEYSIEYGGKISREVAIKLSEAYLKFKAAHSSYNETDDIGVLIEEDWVYLAEPPKPPGEPQCNESEMEEAKSTEEEKGQELATLSPHICS
jgi:hypothetical protein